MSNRKYVTPSAIVELKVSYKADKWDMFQAEEQLINIMSFVESRSEFTNVEGILMQRHFDSPDHHRTFRFIFNGKLTKEFMELWNGWRKDVAKMPGIDILLKV